MHTATVGYDSAGLEIDSRTIHKCYTYRIINSVVCIPVLKIVIVNAELSAAKKQIQENKK